MNAPRDGGTTDPDLAFEPGVSRLKVTDPLSTQGETAGDALISATATVSCFDYGASADLRVTAEMDDGEQITGYVRGDRSRSVLVIPKRDPGSKIASFWKQTMKVEHLPDEDDSENDPVGDGFQGDGLTLYEEYRGFMNPYGYRRMDPTKKELFVCDELKDGTEAAFTRFQKISGITVRTLLPDQHRDRVINFNHSGDAPHRCDQHLIVVQPPRSALDMATEFTGGFTFRLNDGRKATTPRSVDRIVIKTKDESVPAVGHDLAAQTASYREIVIVHEMLHAVNVSHHGEGDVLAGVEWRRQDTPPAVLENGKPVQVFRESATPVPLKSFDEMFDQPFKLVLAMQNGAFSGDQACVMRYAGADAYVFPTNRSTRRIYIAHETPEAWGLELCSSPDGTGVNAPARQPNPRYGRAAKGRCAQQLRVSDADP
jgi:hypothetical protein